MNSVARYHSPQALFTRIALLVLLVFAFDVKQPILAQTTNLAQGRPATASSAETNNPVASGNDGSTSTRWCAANGSTGHWWKVDLGSVRNLTGSEVMWEFSGRVYRYRVEVSTNDSTWTTVADKTNNTSTAQTQADSFTASARYVRITFTGLPTSPVTWASFWEFRVFGTGSPTPTPTPGPANQNPALPGLYADPHAAILGNTFYIYPTTDGFDGWRSTSFKVWSSTNLVDWTDRGVILDLANISWCSTHDRAWAPAIVQRGSTYYFYFSACTAIGVATSSSPTGPFTDALGRPLVTAGQFGGQSIDPMVFIDDDGQAYLYFGQGEMNVVRLNADMRSFNGTPVNIAPAGYNEGTFVFKRNGTYYIMWSENDTRSEDYRVAYGTASSPMGPITRRGIILSKNLSLGIKGTGHHSVLRTSSGAYYIVYHRFAIPNGDGMHREVCIDRMEFNADGTIRPVTVTLAGITAPVTP